MVKNCAKSYVLLLIAMLGSSAFSVSEPQTDTEQDVAVETYDPPVPLEKENPNYPRDAQLAGIEGWVTLHYMVSPSGNPYEIEVVDSSGNRSLERAARRAAKKYQYDPAQLNGTPIDAGAATRITFALSGGVSGVSVKFKKLYRRFQEAAQNGNLKDMEVLIAKINDLETQNLFEASIRYTVQGSYAQLINDHEGVRMAFARAIDLDEDQDGAYLTEPQRPNLLVALMQAQVATQHFKDALDTWKKLAVLIEDPQRKSRLQRQAYQIQQFIQEGGPIEVTGRIRGHYRYKYRLIGNSFSVSSINGRLAEAQIYCDRGIKGFALEEDMSFEIPEEFGECNLIIIGDPETTFTVFEGS